MNLDWTSIRYLALLLESWGLSNHDLVVASPEQLTHKQVQRACHGRKLTLKMKQKLARTLNFAIWGRLTNDERKGFSEYFAKHLFNYSKGFETDVWLAALRSDLEKWNRARRCM